MIKLRDILKEINIKPKSNKIQGIQHGEENFHLVEYPELSRIMGFKVESSARSNGRIEFGFDDIDPEDVKKFENYFRSRGIKFEGNRYSDGEFTVFTFNISDSYVEIQQLNEINIKPQNTKLEAKIIEDNNDMYILSIPLLGNIEAMLYEDEDMLRITISGSYDNILGKVDDVKIKLDQRKIPYQINSEEDNEIYYNIMVDKKFVKIIK